MFRNIFSGINHDLDEQVAIWSDLKIRKSNYILLFIH